MVAPTGDSSESVRYDILIEAKSALQSMRTLLTLTKDNNEKMLAFTAQVIESAKAWGVSWKEALAVYKQLNQELAKQKKGTLFGQTGGQDVMGNAEKYMQALDDAGRAAETTAQKTNAVADGANRLGTQGESATKKFALGLHFVRIALGALEAMLLFGIVQAIQTAFGNAIKYARQFEDTLYRLRNVEQSLSMEGIEISMAGLKKGITDIQKLLPIFSKEDVAGLVGQLAISTKQLKLNETQILDLAKAVAILNVRSEKNEELSATAQNVLSSLLTGNAKGVSALGIAFTDNLMTAKALELGYLDAGEALTALTENEKGLTKLAIIMDSVAGETANVSEYLESNSAKVQRNKAAWNDLLTTIGQTLLPFLPLVTGFFNTLANGFNFLKSVVVVIMSVLTTFVTVFRMVMNGSIKSLDDLKNKFQDVADAARKMFAKLFFPGGVPEGAPKWFKDTFGKDLQDRETPTAPGGVDLGGDAAAQEEIVKKQKEYQDKLQEIMKDSADKKLDIERDYQRKLEDIARDYQNKLVDIARSTAEKREDALRNYNQKVDDINRDTNEKIAEAQQEARQKEIDREAEFQNKLRELREKFLFDLEDALRERDARQVLRLIRQYNLDKTNLEERHRFDREQEKKNLADKLTDIEHERQLKLAAAEREYDEKLNEIKIGEARALQEARIWQNRQLQDARIWHQRQLQEQREYLQRKLRDLAEALAQEYQMTAANQAAMDSLLSGVSSSGGTVSPTNTSVSYGGGFTTFSPNGTPTYNPYDVRYRSSMGFAEGGNFIATRPTKIDVGERGAEQVSITPLTKIGNNVGNTYGDRSAMGMGGNLKLALELSPDLEARIVESSLDNVAITLEKIRRSK